MNDPQIECRLELSDTDFIMRNHRVHGVSVLPGVTFLDILMRMLVAQGFDPERVELRRILFPEPVATAESAARELRLRVGPPGPDGARPVTAQSRWAGRPDAPWHDNMRAELVHTDPPPAAPLDLAALRAGIRRSYPLAELYARARAEDIRHGPAMACHGDIHVGDGYLLAELDIDAGASVPEEAFHLHPAKLDAATIAAYGQTEAVSREPFIPMYIDRFRAPRPLRGTTILYAPRVETLSASRDVIDNDYGLYATDGTLLAEFGKLTCKRIRHAGLISRLVADATPTAGAAAASPTPTPAALPTPTPAAAATPVPATTGDAGGGDVAAGGDAVRAYTGHLRGLVGARLGRSAADVPVDAGFYELGLDSVAMLDLGRQLEEVAGTALYPTLLFEHTDIAALAAYLGTTHGFRRAEPAAAGPAGPAECEVTLWRAEWTPAPASAAPDGGRPLVVLGADDATLAALRAARPGVDVRPAEGVDPTDAEQVGRLVDRSGPAAYVRLAATPETGDPARPAIEMWTLATALHRRHPSTPAPLLYVHRLPDPAGAAVGALGRTLGAEAPALRVRSVGVADWSATGVAEAVWQEVADPTGGAEVRRAERRVTRGYAPLPAPAGPSPLREAGVYVITGADGALAGLVGDHLAQRYRARLVLLGRRPLGDPLAGRIAAWRSAGAEVLHVVADLTDAAAVRRAVDGGRERFGRIDGVLHLAGVLRDGLFPTKHRTDFTDVAGPKAVGARHLDAATATDRLAFFALFSSLSAVVPNPGQCDYAFANAYLEHFAAGRAARPDRHGASIAVAWPLWADGGMRIPAEAVARSRREHGAAPLPTADGLRALETALAAGDGTVVVRYTEPDRAADGLPQPTPAAPAPAAPVVDVAVVGLAGRYPQAADVREFWANLVAGRDCVTEVPAQRWDHDRYFDADRGRAGRTYGRWGGFLDDVDVFDPGFFGISRKDAERMDPQERLFLTTAWQAVEDAGYQPQHLRGAPVGVYAGVTWSHYQLFDEDGVAPTAMHASVPNRVSYTLGLTGPSLAVDTACSSSLSAVHLAVRAVRQGDCDLAIAGGVNLTLHPQKYLQLAQGQFLSTDGRCRSFGEGGDGYVPAEGVGAVVLKRLDDARRDGDHVYGVIRASTLNHAGRTSGFTVPSPTAQADLVRATWRSGGVAPETVSYVEAHGTGTSLGDPIEIEALRAVFAESAPPGGCAVGSVKSSIGHAESAAGIAALTKVLLQLRHRTLVPSLHAERVNPHIDLTGTPLRIQRELASWSSGPDGGPRRAGVSAFGAGGANAHLLVEEAPPAPPAERDSGPAIFVLSARDEATLRRYAGRMAAALAEAPTGGAMPGDAGALAAVTGIVADLLGVAAATVGPDETLGDLGLDRAALLALRDRVAQRCGAAPPPAEPIDGSATPRTVAALLDRAGTPDGVELADVAYTSQLGRAAMAHRLAVVTADVAALRAALRAVADGGELPAGTLLGVAERDSGDQPDAAPLEPGGDLLELAARWVRGADVAWERLHRPGTRRRVPLPGYPFGGERCWVGQWRRRGAGPAGDSAGPADLPGALVRTPTGPDRPADRPAADARPATPAPAGPVGSGGRHPDADEAGPEDPDAPVDVRVVGDGVAVVTMRGARNMFTEALVRGLEQAFAEIAAQPAVRAVVLTASGPAFSMGGTPDALERLARGDGRFSDVPFLYRGLLRCDRPVVAAITGHASGGGLAFGLYADIVVMAREASYAANFVHYGFTPGMGATFILEQRFGRALATEMFYTARAFDGVELERRGAQVRFEDRSDVLPAALGIARAIARQPETAVAGLKRELADRLLTAVDDTVSRELALHERVLGDGAVALVRDHMDRVNRFVGGPAPAAAHAEVQATDAHRAGPAADAEGAGQVGGRSPAPVSVPAAPAPAAPVPPAPVAVAPTQPTPPPAAPGPVAGPVEVGLDRDEVLRVIGETLGAQLYLDPHEIDRRLTFSEMGIDSLGAVELVRDLNRRFGLDLDSVTVYDHPTVDQLADHAVASAAEARRLDRAGAEPAVPTEPTAAAPAEAQFSPPPPVPGGASVPAAPAPTPAGPPTQAPAPAGPPPTQAPAPAGPPPLRLAPVTPPAPAAAPERAPRAAAAPKPDLPPGANPSTDADRPPAADLSSGANPPPGADLSPGTGRSAPWAPAVPAPARGSAVTVALAALPPPPNGTAPAAPGDLDGSRPSADTSGPVEPDRLDQGRSPAGGHAATADIAVIGMSGRFPDAPDVETFWRNLRDGRCSIREVPAQRWDPAEFYDPDRHAAGRTYSKWAALLSDVDSFDAAFFRISPMEAELMDPQQRLFLEQSWAALDDAGYATAGPRRCGVFVGSGGGDYLRLLERSGQDDTGQAFLGNAPSILAARIGYLLDLTGPTMSVDTACSSSLVAVHLAVESLRSGACDMAIAGGVAVMVTPRMHVWTSKTGMLSPTGRCAPFDASADGIVLGEAVGAVVLKRLDRAVADGDHVYAVVKGTGLNGDGHTNGITAPSAESQAALLRDVYARSGVSPADVGYVEAHGTGTPLGDPIELKALTSVFTEHARGRSGWCAVGSVKSNVGHTTLAAGITGFIKAVQALRHRVVPPSLSFDTPNPRIDLAGGPFTVPVAPAPFPPGPAGVRVAAVSSFGFSGTNAHVVLAEAPDAPPPADGARDEVVVVLSAANEGALARRVAGLRDALPSGVPLRDVAYTLGAGRAHLPVRAAFVVGGLDELRDRLAAWTPVEPVGRAEPPDAQTVRADVAAARAATGPAARRTALHRLAAAYVAGADPDWALLWRGEPVRRVPLPSYPFERETHWAAPARAGAVPPTGAVPDRAGDAPADADGWRLDPADELVAGHRVSGRPVLAGAASACWALLARGGPARLTGLRWLRPVPVTAARTLRLRSGDGGAFTVVGEDGEPYAGGAVEPLPPAAPQRLDLDAVAARCPQVRPGAELYAGFAAAGLDYGEPYRRIVSVRVGAGEALASLARPAAPVPVGPGLTAPAGGVLDARCLDGAWQAVAVLTDADGAAGPLVPFAVERIDVPHPDAVAAHVHVERTGPYDFRVTVADAAGRVALRCTGFALRAERDQAGPLLLRPAWVEPPRAPDGRAQLDGRALVVAAAGTGAQADALAARLGPDTLRARLGEPLPAAASTVDAAYVLAGTGSDDGETTTVAAVRTVRALATQVPAGRALRLTVAAAGAVATCPGDAVHPGVAGVFGVARAAAAEHRAWAVSCVDVGLDADPATTAARVAADAGGVPLLAWRDGRALRRAFVRVRPAAPAADRDPFRERGVYLVTGGAGGLGAALSLLLARRRAARLLWTGRRGHDDTVEAALRAVREAGGEAEYVRADVTDPAAVRHALDVARRRYGRLDGVLHAAGLWRDAALTRLDDDAVAEVLAPKLTGTAVLLDALRDEPLDLCVLFSSAASFVDAGGQANYAAASVAQDACAARAAGRVAFPVTVVNWGYWGGVGAVAGSGYARRFADLGVRSIEPEAGYEALRRVLAAGLPQALVLDADPTRLPEYGITLVESAPPAPAATRLDAAPPTGPVALPGAGLAGTPQADQTATAGTGPAAVTAGTGPAAATAEAGGGEVPGVAAVRDYLREAFAEVLKCRPETLRDRETFETYGIDSLVGVDIVHRLAADLGELPATLLFEHMTLDRLATHLRAERPAELARALRADDPGAGQPAASGARATGDEPGPAATGDGPKPAATGATATGSGAGQPAAAAAGDAAGGSQRAASGAGGSARPVAPGDIAVVGVTGRYPESPDLDALWRNLRAGANCIREVPASRWDWREHYDPRRGRRNRTYGRWAGFIADVDMFDAAHFSVLPRDAAAMDPQERLFLETCWNLLEETGHLGPRRHEPATGVFVGTMYGSYGKLAAATGWPRGEFAGAHSAYWSLANRVSYTFDLTGPSFAVDSACSSSLTAVHLACESLRRGECRMAIAGGVNVIIHPAHLVALSAMNMLATGDGCRTFDAHADGYVPGEGVGAVLLKPLAAALADGDHIWAVIKASLANAGGKTSGYTVPNPNSQADLVRETLRRAGVEPGTIGYVEAHGTGTELGDPIEIASLTRAFGPLPDGSPPCPVGSVKANVGHLEGAAGIVGLTKVLLQLRHGELVPAANLDTVNPKIDFAGSPFRPQRELVPWRRGVEVVDGEEREVPRRAGVSSFGAGGANVHVVVEEPPEVTGDAPEVTGDAPEVTGDAPAPQGPRLFLLSARAPERLRAYAGRVAEHLRGSGGGGLDAAALAYTSQVGRREFDERLAARAEDVAALARSLAEFATGDAGPDLVCGTASARPPAAPDDADTEALARAWVGGADVDWPARWDRRPRLVSFPTYPFARRRFWLPDPAPIAAPPAADPAGTTETDPAEAGTVQSAATETGTVQSGIDLGGDGPHLTDHRVRGERWLPGAALLDGVRRAAAAAGVTGADVVRDLRWLAPVRLDGGTARLSLRLVRAGAVTTFAVGGAGAEVATGVLEPATGDPVAPDLDAVRARCRRAHDVTDFYAALADGGLDYGPGLRVVRELWSGDGEALARLRGTPGGAAAGVALADGALQALAALGTAADARVPVGFDRAEYAGPATDAGWAWVRRSGPHRFDLDLTDDDGRPVLAVRGLRVAPAPARDDAGVWYLSSPTWSPEPLGPDGRAAVPSLTVLLAADDAAATPTRELLERRGGRCVVVVPGDAFARTEGGFVVRPGAHDDLHAVVRRLAAEGPLPDAVLRLPAAGPAWTGGDDPAGRVADGFLTLLWLCTALLAERTPGELRIGYGFASASPAGQPHDAAVVGALRTLALEHQRVRGVVVGFEGADATAGPQRHAEPLVDELLICGPQVARVRYGSGLRRVRGLDRAVTATAPAPAPAAPLFPRPGGAYLLTGGAGGLGLRFARHLAAGGAGAVVLVGRSPLDAARRAALDELRADGTAVEYHALDVTDAAALTSLVAEVAGRHGPLRGVLHAAGVTRDARAVRKTPAQVAEVLAPKVDGALAVDRATAEQPLDFLAFFSSVVAETGNPGQVDYAYANAFLGGFAALREQWRGAGTRSGRTVAVAWPLWRDSGMTVDAATLAALRRRWGMVPLDPADGLRAFEAALALGSPEVTVTSTTAVRPAVPAPPAATEVDPPAATALTDAPHSPPPDAAGPADTADAAAPGADAQPDADAGSADLLPPVLDELRELAASFLLVDPVEVESGAELMDLGFDSISLTELINQVNERYGLDLLPTVLFECPDLATFAAYLVTNHPAAMSARHREPAPAASDASTAPDAPEAPDAPDLDALDASATPDAPADSAVAGSADVAAGPAPAVAVPAPAPRRRVAIIGMAGTLPGSADLDEFWRHLRAGDDLVGEVPEDRADLRADPGTRHLRGGFLSHVDRFDARFFGVAPREAALMDPQQRLFLQTAWQAVQDAGYRPSALAGTATGLYAGVSTSDYQDLLRAHGVPVEAHTATGVAHSILANRVSYLLDLRGPSEIVDTACSSSLVAIHRAIAAIRAGDCDLALAGGVNVLLSPGLFTAFTQSGMLSPDGRCKTFDADADGYVRGEGCGVVLLKDLEQAERDGDHIYAEVLGSAVNHGGRASSLTAPNPAAQARVVAAAFRDAAVDPATVTYLESHGTGTRLGDPVEIEGIKQALETLYAERGRPVTAAPGTLAVGAVKTNIGHLEAAAGIAGVLKVLLAMRHGELPPSLHLRRVNPHIRLDATPLRLQTQLTPWPGVADGAPVPLRRAGVSSFGFGGTNAHVLLEAYRPAPAADAPPPDSPYAFVLSAPTPEALAAYAGRVAEHLTTAAPDLARVAWTLQTGREDLPERLAVVAGDRAAFAAAARGEASGAILRGTVRRRPAGEPTPVATGTDQAELARAWVDGARVDWPAAWAVPPRRTPLPGFPFAETRHWFPTPAAEPSTEVALSQPAEAPASAAVPPVARRPKLRLTRPTTPATPTSPPPAPAPALAAAPAAPPPAPAPPTAVPAPAAARRDPAAVAEVVVGRLGQILGTPTDEIPPDQPFSDLGLDSIYRMELVRLLNSTFDLDLKATELYEYDTVDRLTAFVAAAEPARPEAAPPEPARPVPTGAGGPADDPEAVLAGVIDAAVQRPWDPAATFVDNGFTSFDMLRVVAALERGLGAMRKTVLFDHPTLPDLTAHLAQQHGAALVGRLHQAAPPQPHSVAPRVADADGPLMVVKRELDPQTARLVAELEQRHGKEGGLPGRDIAPLLFVGSRRTAYFNASERDGVLLAWSYVGSAADLEELTAEWVAYAERHGLRPNQLSMVRLSEVAGRPFTATPFGVVQRLDKLPEFSLDGGPMSRVRSLVRRFERAGRVRLVEYRVGSDPATDRAIVDLIDGWCATKEMINPYVGTVRDEIGRGVLAERHRMFLTYVDDRLNAAVIVTKIPSEPGYLLDLEFYPGEMPRGGLEYTVVKIIERTTAEGSTMFSFGGTFGVQVTASPNADPAVDRALVELRQSGVFSGEGNFRFKNKFRPVNLPIYLCRPADADPADVTAVLLMITNPSVRRDDLPTTATPPAPPRPAAPPVPTAPPVTAPPALPVKTAAAPPVAAAPAPGPARVTTAPPAGFQHQLDRYGHNPVRVPAAEVDIDLLTDSWAELDADFVRAGTAALRERTAGHSGVLDLGSRPTLPFACVVPTGSGRAAEALLCRAWPSAGRYVVQNPLFPTWALSRLDRGLTALPVRRSGGGADLDPAHLGELLRAHPGDVAFVAVELSTNALGGPPVRLANLRRVREVAAEHGVGLVLDATRVVENAVAESDRERRDPWPVVTELLGLADAVTMGLSKDFAVDRGGLVATNDPALAERLREHVTMRGCEANLADRRLIEAALADPDRVVTGVRERMAAVAALAAVLRDADLPVVEPVGGHCVLLDTARMPRLAGLAHPVPALLSWLYAGTGVRGGAHHGADDVAGSAAWIRLAVPVGLPVERATEAGRRIAERFGDPAPVPDLLLVEGTGPAAQAAYHPVDRVPDDVRQAMDEGHRPADENWAVLREHQPLVRRELVRLADGEVEVFVAGDEGGDGDGDRPTLLLMPPFNIGAGFYGPQFAALTDRLRVVAVHHAGVGATTAAADLSIDGIVDLVSRTAEALGLREPLHLAGASFGGLPAAAFALRHPGRTASLTLISSSYKVGNRAGQMNRLSLVAEEDFDRLAQVGVAGAEQRAQWLRLLLRCESMDAQIGLRYLDEFAANPDLLGRLPELRVPTLLVHGRLDSVVPLKTAHLLHGTIPDARYEELPDAGHFPSLTHSARVNALLAEFTVAATGRRTS
ncbi:SDR family NAD(P)-dependent oxidoreductase [Micromonospora sp. DT233]|uniref:SDR family NAD(P)-dependent oxidoreductase n=1 Tax=Micromonospora sp. DT233 TaxID=3393432 RepID=UPI003CED0329